MPYKLYFIIKIIFGAFVVEPTYVLLSFLLYFFTFCFLFFFQLLFIISFLLFTFFICDENYRFLMNPPSKIVFFAMHPEFSKFFDTKMTKNVLKMSFLRGRTKPNFQNFRALGPSERTLDGKKHVFF